MDILHYISGPLIGAVIGYCTNYIAVKMLFRPLKEIKIGRFTLPFTPGIIPKRKNELAAAVGKAVGNSLLTEDDLTGMLLSEDVENSITDICISQFGRFMESEQTLCEVITGFMGSSAYEEGRVSLKNGICNKIMRGIQEMEPGNLIAEEGKRAVRQKLEGSMFAMFLSDKLLDSIAAEIGAYAEDYILENGPAFIENQVEQELSGLEGRTFAQVRGWIPMDEELIRRKIRDIYRMCIGRFANSIVQQFHIADIVENKIREMDVKDLENLVMSVMKHELGMIVNLGALIGLILGIFNLFF
ncbi:MAG: DUF445 family protein [Eubacteriales bacterium]|nr:DUF445 family protein [Eubacteriales bacterium]